MPNQSSLWTLNLTRDRVNEILNDVGFTLATIIDGIVVQSQPHMIISL